MARTKGELVREHVPYVVGITSYSQVARGEIAGDHVGLLKLLVHEETRRLLGVHIIGASATDLVHVGQAVIAGELPVDYLTDTSFNAPTFTEVYRLAALDARNRLDNDTGRDTRHKSREQRHGNSDRDSDGRSGPLS